MKKKIYIVDDHDMVRSFAIEAYERVGYETKGFSDAGSMLEAIANGEKPDLILMDTEMPGIKGYEACDRIKKNEVTSYIKVIGTSGNTTDGYEQKWKEAGRDDYITKPFNLIDLLNKTRELLGE